MIFKVNVKNMVQDFSEDKSKVNKVLHFHYLICMLLPVLKQLNQDQSIELEIEAKIKGSHKLIMVMLVDLMKLTLSINPLGILVLMSFSLKQARNPLMFKSSRHQFAAIRSVVGMFHASENL